MLKKTHILCVFLMKCSVEIHQILWQNVNAFKSIIILHENFLYFIIMRIKDIFILNIFLFYSQLF